MDKVNIVNKLSLFNEYWNPKIVGELNDSYVKVAKLKGEFLWHSHENEDELFWIIKGTLLVKFRDKVVTVKEGEFLIIPKGTEHMPVAEDEVHVVLIEPRATLNTGDIVSERTVEKLERI